MPEIVTIQVLLTSVVYCIKEIQYNRMILSSLNSIWWFYSLKIEYNNMRYRFGERDGEFGFGYSVSGACRICSWVTYKGIWTRAGEMIAWQVDPLFILVYHHLGWWQWEWGFKTNWKFQETFLESLLPPWTFLPLKVCALLFAVLRHW